MNAFLSSLPDHPPVMRLGLTLLHFLWQGTLLALVAVVVRRLLHTAAAPVRRRAAITFLNAAAVCPAVTFLVLSFFPEISSLVAVSPDKSQPKLRQASVSAVETGYFPQTTEVPQADDPSGSVLEESGSARSDDPSTAPAFSASAPQPVSAVHAASPASYPAVNLRTLLPWLVLFWGAGVTLLTLRYTGGWWLMRRWRRETTPVPPEWERHQAGRARRLGITGTVRILASVSGRGPAMAGILRPVILIPASAFAGLDPAHLEAVLLHELAHLKQRDQWVTVLLTLTGTMLFYHPAVWLLSEWVRAEREHAADELAAQACGDRTVYARALAGLAAFDNPPTHALAADGGDVAARIRRLLGNCGPEPRVLSGSLLPVMAAALGALCLSFPLSAQTQEQVSPTVPDTPASTTVATTVTPADGQTLQARIDAAEAGAVIQLGEGVFETNLILTKSITLEGTGESKTSIRQLSREAGSVLTLRGAKNVTIRGLRVIALPVESDGNTLASTGAVEVEDSDFIFEKCSITGPAHNGMVLKSSAATVRDCLISGMWSNGITIGRGCHDVSITGTDVRNCFYSPIVIGRQTERILIDSCRISGGAWHGIRYDDTSPQITNCLIFQNARCGIYASGRTRAVIRGNVFLANEMGGISCWFANEDTIEGNTFPGNLRESISVLGGSKPVIRRNIFTDSPTAIMLGKIGGNEHGQEDAAPVIEENLLWNNAKEFRGNNKEEVLPENTKTVREDPLFMDAKARDFRLSESSPAKKQKIGALEPIVSASPWPLTESEKQIIPDGESRSYELWKTAGYRKRSDEEATRKQRAEAQTKAEAWKNEALQIDSVDRRDAAISAIRAAVGSPDPQVALPGLMALSASVAAEFDKLPFRAPVRRWMVSKNPALRNAALSAMFQIGAEAEDLNALYTMAEDKATADRAGLVIYMHWIGKGDLTGRGGKVALELLGDDDPERQRSVLNALWGARFSQELEDRVIALSRTDDHQKSHDAVYYALSPQANKSAQTIDRLMEIMSGKAGGDPQRASWGLGQGVSKTEASQLAKLAVRLFTDNVSPEVRDWCLKLIRTYGSRDELPFLDQTAARPAVTATIRKAVEEAKTAIAARAGENGSTVTDTTKEP